MEKRILFILTGFIAGVTIALFVYYNIIGAFPAIWPLLILTIGGGAAGLVLQTTFYKTSQFINHRVSWQSQFSLRFAIDFFINSIIGIAVSAILLSGVLAVTTKTSISVMWQDQWEAFAVLWILTTVFVIFYNIIMLVFYAYYHYAEGQISSIVIERKQLKLQYEALKSQLSPHYLFNSLNTISSLIHKDKDSAEEFIRRLADTYNYILRTHKQPLVSIQEELEFVKAYYYLLCVRYREGLKLDINIPDQLHSAKVPPMTLQILVENAIKHNLFTEEKPLSIYIGVIDNKSIRVINNKTEPPASVKSTKIGLNNIEMRYSYFTRDNIKIANSDNFEVRVPIIQEKEVIQAA